LQAHVALGQCGERGISADTMSTTLRFSLPQELRFVFLPPDIRRTTAIVHDDNLPRAPTCFANALLVGLAQLNPFENLARHVLAPKIGFVVIADAFAERKELVAYSTKASRRTINRSSVSDGCCANVSVWWRSSCDPCR